jgi:pimeloyl-ACP methyl ester carboxylesterase
VSRLPQPGGARSTVLAVREQTRARYPDEEGYVEGDGVRVFWERYGEGEPTFLLPPTWEIVHSRHWKMQTPYLSRHGRVVTFDPRGNGRSDRPRDYDAYRRHEFARDAVAVLDAAGVDRAIVIAWCDMGDSLILAAEHPERVAGVVFIAPALPTREAEVAPYPFDEVLDTEEGWAKENRHYWLRDWRGYLEWFFSQCFTEPHSTKQVEDCVGWGQETDAETILAGFRGWAAKELDPETVVGLCARVRCPTLVVQGTEDELVDPEWGVTLAEELGSPLLMLEGVGPAQDRTPCHGSPRNPARKSDAHQDHRAIHPRDRPAWQQPRSTPRRHGRYLCTGTHRP